MTDELWNEFFGSGWEYGKTPTKRECFEAGLLKGIGLGTYEERLQSCTEMGLSTKFLTNNKPEQVRLIIKEWHDKFEASDK